MALILKVSTKDPERKGNQEGLFGMGKYTNLEGVDRLEIINKNTKGAYMFTYTVFKTELGEVKDVRLTGIRKVTDPRLNERLEKTGVIWRRIKYVENTVPELEKLLAERLEDNAGLAQDNHFKIYFIDADGKRRQLKVEHEILSEVDLTGWEADSKSEFPVRVIKTKDMPLQIISRSGLRVMAIPKRFMALIPPVLFKHIAELGLNIQLPLKLIVGRDGFQEEDESAVQ